MATTSVVAQINYGCIKTQPEYTAIVPKCAQYCHVQALTNDGCDRDDHICHCKNTNKVAGMIEPCLFGPNPGPAGRCSTDSIKEFATIAKGYCGFWNQTANDALQSQCCRPIEEFKGYW
ncbi:hypothetical protein KVR01_008972 [Diaporthe batatas]|uniref:uncharacterized protein n=1 Tax=Diaporthe batatas TaxID=748121 RepID=UPI001D04A127|nr:uncharacterized protein KVR01_008972 [Diaporthe batatas]KAG8160708.1 hypothetical protein KVR01_008972 [Diaporthe batatas]